MDPYLRSELKRYVPLAELRSFIEICEGEPLRSCNTKDDAILHLDPLILSRRELINELYTIILKYKFAGKGSVSWSIPVERKKLTKSEFQDLINQRAGGDDAFTRELRPEITREPALNKAEWLEGDILRLEFVYKDRSQFVETDYSLQEIWPTRRSSILIYILNDSFIIESRADFNQASHLHRIASSLLGIDTQIIDFSDEDIERLKEMLNARKWTARHKRSSGDIDVIEMTASPTIEDLDDSEEYQRTLSGDELKKAGYRFNHTTSEGADLDITINVSKKGSIWFMSSTPEEVRDYVFSCIRDVKNL